MNPYIIAVISVTIASLSQVLLKKSSMKKYPSFIREYLNPYVIIGYMMLLGSMMITIYVFKQLPFMSIPIIESLGYVLVLIFGLLFFGEKITKRKLIGMIVIIAGIIIYNI